MPKPPPGHEAEVHLVARILRSVRGARTQEDIAAQFGLSDAAWSRFEKREQVPDLSVASAVDAAFTLEGRLVRPVQVILFGAEPDPPREFHTVVFVPEYLGPVWVHVCAAVGAGVVPTTVTLQWGAFTRVVSLELDEVGFGLSFSKLDRGNRSTPLRVKGKPAFRMRYGTGMPDHLADDRVLDENDGWTAGSHVFPTPDPDV